MVIFAAMAHDPCPVCEALDRANQAAYQDWATYRPSHSGFRPKSMWLKDDQKTKNRLEFTYIEVRTRYERHLATHPDLQGRGSSFAP